MGTSTEVRIYPKPKKVCKKVAQEIRKYINEWPKPRYDIALSGGSTPKKLFKVLSKKYRDTIPWDKIHFWWGDERCVPMESDESNYKMAKDHLFTKISLPERNIHRIKGENQPEDEAIRYAAEIRNNLKSKNSIPVFDIILLGLGEDGHTASIFPDQLHLFGEEKWCVAVNHPETKQNRITLTGKVLNNARRIYFLATGESKAARISEIMNNDDAAKNLPAYHVEPVSGELIWFIDESAASKIS
jgi:6-phosphogluconolactonase